MLNKIDFISDMHGQLTFDVSPCDILVIAGDICPNFRGGLDSNVYGQLLWMRDELRPWLKRQPARRIVATWGNHDHIGAHDYRGLRIKDIGLPWTLLLDEAATIEGIKFYGTPWSRTFRNWVFMCDEHRLAEKYAAIPNDTDILISHGPPYGYGDIAFDDSDALTHVGSPHLLERIRQVKPAVVTYGHIHSGNGFYGDVIGGESLLINASLIDEQYKMVYKPAYIVMNDRRVIEWGTN